MTALLLFLNVYKIYDARAYIYLVFHREKNCNLIQIYDILEAIFKRLRM